MRALTGAIDLPSPVISVVTPCVIFDAARPSTSTKSSDWPSMSMKPGATTSPVTSMRVRAVAGDRSPMAAMRSPAIAEVGPHPRRAGAVDEAAAAQTTSYVGVCPDGTAARAQTAESRRHAHARIVTSTIVRSNLSTGSTDQLNLLRFRPRVQPSRHCSRQILQTRPRHRRFRRRPIAVGADRAVAAQRVEAHAKFRVERVRCFVSDLGSRCGTFVGGGRIAAETEIVAGDRVRLGEVDLILAHTEPRVQFDARPAEPTIVRKVGERSSPHTQQGGDDGRARAVNLRRGRPHAAVGAAAARSAGAAGRADLRGAAQRARLPAAGRRRRRPRACARRPCAAATRACRQA